MGLNVIPRRGWPRSLPPRRWACPVKGSGDGGAQESGTGFYHGTVALIALIALSPILLLIAVAIRIDSRGPILFVSERMGTGQRIFRFLKFRTMYQGADADRHEVLARNTYRGIFLKTIRDPRVTRVGRWLRRTSLDELPQLVNVVRGEMSLVGNRPLPLDEARRVLETVGGERFDAPCGLTGLWQVERAEVDLSADDRIALDLRYARRRSFLVDILILLRTPGALWQKDE